MDDLIADGDWWGVAESCRRQLQLEPANGALLCNQANALWLHDQPQAALPLAQQAVACAPLLPQAWSCLGNVLLDLGAFERSLEAYNRCQQLGANPVVDWNCSKVLLALGRYDEAYAHAEQRFSNAALTFARPGPYWQGWPQAQQLWVWSEEGFGDVLQHLRWLVPLLQQGRQLCLELEPALVELVRQGLAWAGGALQVCERTAEPRALPPGSCQGSLLSLPLLLGGAPQPSVAPYLRLSCEGPAPPHGRRPRVGLVWASGRFLDGAVPEREYYRKSLLGPPLRSLLNGLAQRPLELVALQHGPDREPPPWLGRFAAELSPQADFAATAVVMQQLDLVISVDTAAAHLAGALGLPVWTLLPWSAEARWGREATTPWYPGMRLLRQPQPQDWYGLVRLLLGHLDVWLGRWAAGQSSANSCS